MIDEMGKISNWVTRNNITQRILMLKLPPMDIPSGSCGPAGLWKPDPDLRRGRDDGPRRRGSCNISART